ncbi:MAG: TonB-dependent receptor, partial [Bacteroidetes bacterium]|nr:TonB-dependent receptor [Bacteroidota bacterium]
YERICLTNVNKSMKRTFLFLWYIHIFSFLSFSQGITITGIVRDAVTNSPIQQANILLKEHGTIAVTDSLGRFFFTSLSPGWYTISATHPQYQVSEHRLFLNEQTHPLTFELTTLLYTVPPVIVQSVRSPSELQYSPYPLAYIDGARFFDFPSQTVSEELNRIPGVALIRDGMWATTVNVRGLSRYDIVTIHDGVRIETAQDLAAGLSLINPYDLERIEVVKGPSHASTGTIGGVIQSIVRTPSFTENVHTSWEGMGRYESVNNLHGEHFAVELTSSSLRFRGSGMFRKAENYQTPQGYMPNSQFTDFSGSFFLGTKVFTSHLFNISYQRAQAENVGIPGGKSIAPTATATYKLARRELIKAEYIAPNISPQISRLHIHIARQTIQRNVQLVVNPTLTKTPHALHTLYSVQGEISFTPFENHFTTAGIEYWQRTIDSKRESYDTRTRTVALERPLPDAKYTCLGIFFQDEWQIAPSFTTFTLGARYDAIQISNPTTYNIDWVLDSLGQKYTPSTRQLLWKDARRTTESWNVTAGLHHSFMPTLNASLLFAVAERSANIEERFQFLSLGRNTFLGNPNLTSERSYNTNCNLHWNYGPFSVEADVYSHFFVNLIADTLLFSTSTTQTFSKYNIRRAKIYGYEIVAKYTPVPTVLFQSTVSYTRGEDFTHKTNLPQIPPLKATLSTQYMDVKYGTLSLEWEGVASQNYTASRTAGETRTAGYALVHVSYKSNVFNFFSTRWTLRCGIQNLFNRAYIHHLSTLRLVKLEPGRNVWCSLSIEQ